MSRSWPYRIPFAALLFALTASLTTTPPPSNRGSLPRVESELRVTRHFAAGLEYVLVEPPDLPPDAELPMVVYIHGRSDRPRPPRHDVFGLTTPVRLIMPRGPERSGPGYAWAPVSAHNGESPPLLEALDSSASMLSQAIAEWQRRYPTRGRPIVAGFSQGGILALTLAVREPAAYARVIPLAGWLPPSFLPPPADPYAVNAPIFALHGESDPVLGSQRTAHVIDALDKLGYPAVFESYPAGHEVTDAMSARLRELLEEALRALPDRDEAAGTA